LKTLGFFSFLVSALLWSARTFSAQRPNYYADLNVRVNATQEEINVAFRRLKIKYDPQNTRDPEAPEKLQRVLTAYYIIGDVNKRATYDLSQGYLTKTDAPNTPAKLSQTAFTIAKAVRGSSIRYDGDKLSQFTNAYQVEALKIVAPIRGIFVHHDYDDLLLFSNSVQIEALRLVIKIRGIYVHHDYQSLLNFSNQHQIDALKLAIPVRGIYVHLDYAQLLNFNNQYSIEALKIAASVRGIYVHHDYDYLKYFENPSQVEALRILAKVFGADIRYNYDLILRFNSPEAIRSLKEALFVPTSLIDVCTRALLGLD
jgi:hypothetical protein